MKSEAVVEATFSWDLVLNGTLESVDEERLREGWEAYRAIALSPEDITGTLKLATEVGEVVVQDDLWHIMVELCFAIPPALSQGSSASFHYLSWHGELRLVVEGPIVRISGDLVPNITMPLNSLVRALVECGLRYRDLLSRSKDDPNASGILQWLDPLSPAAMEALDRVSG